MARLAGEDVGDQDRLRVEHHQRFSQSRPGVGCGVADLGGPANLIQPGLLRFSLHLVAESPEVATRVKERSAGFLGKLAGPRRLSVHVAPGPLQGATQAARVAGLRTKGELLRGVAALTIEDCGITFRDSGGQLVTSRSDAVGRGQFPTMLELARVFA